MAQSALAYDYNSSVWGKRGASGISLRSLARNSSNLAHKLAPEYPDTKPQLRVHTGAKAKAATRSAAASVFATVLVTGCAMLATVTLIACLRVFLVNLTATAMLEAESLQSAIADGRDYGAKLAAQHTLAANPTNIQDLASQYGMVPTKPSEVENLVATTELTPETRAAIEAAIQREKDEHAAVAAALAAQKRAADAVAAASSHDQGAEEQSSANEGSVQQASILANEPAGGEAL